MTLLNIFLWISFCLFLTGLSLFFTGKLQAFLRQKEILDHPNTRSSHNIPTPRGGGIVIVLGFILCWSGLSLSLGIEAQYWAGWCIGMILLALISFMDDLVTLSALPRFGGQICVVILMLAVFPTIGFVPVPQPIFSEILNVGVHDPVLREQMDLLIQGICWLWFINLYNFMDGIDGLAGGETVAICLGIICVVAVMNIGGGGEITLLSWILLSLTLGFLWWNKPPAQIFMGDVGSIPIGFILGALLLYLAGQHALIAAILIPGYFVADATSRLIIRLARRQKFWQAHNQHYYQQALQRGLNHRQVTLTIMGGNVFLIFLAIGSQYFQYLPSWIWIFGGVVTILGVITTFTLYNEN